MKKTLLLLLALPSLVFAQNADKSFRLIPLGEGPVFEFDLINNIRVQREAPAGSIPPQIVASPNGDTAARTFDLSLGKFSKINAYGPKIPQFLLHEGKEVAGATWLKAPMPAFNTGLGVLFRDNAKMTWKSPKMILLDDGKAAFPEGNIRFVNVSDRSVLIKVGNAVGHRLKSGGILLQPLEEGGNSIRVAYEVEGQEDIEDVFKNTITVQGNQRVQSFIYKAQGENPRKKLLFLWSPEVLPAL